MELNEIGKPVTKKLHILTFFCLTWSISFGQTEGTFIDSRDQQVYQWVRIGRQTWMAENLAFLPSVSPPETGSELERHYYVYDYLGSNAVVAKSLSTYSKYGVLYNWPAAMDGEPASTSNPSGVKGVCPTGWHLPGDIEWIELTDYLGVNAATKMKATSGWWDHSGNDLCGFKGLPGGFRQSTGTFIWVTSWSYFWTAKSIDPTNAFGRRLFCYEDEVFARENLSKSFGFSVRCLKDTTDDNTAPVCDFNISINEGPASTVFYFDASLSSDAETANKDLEVRWDWNGDGTWDTGFDTTKVNSHQYSAPGSYSVIMEVKDYGGLMDNKSKTIVVTGSGGEGTFTDLRDYHVYKYVAIGSQIWMAENLAYLPNASPPETGSEMESHYYVYDYLGSNNVAARSISNFYKYGVLYNWTAAVNGESTSSSNPSGIKGVCPAGWHLPSDSEWLELTDYLGEDAAMKMKASSSWWDHNGSNSSGFTGLPGGFRQYDGSFIWVTSWTGFWTTNGIDLHHAFSRKLHCYEDELLIREALSKSFGFSVRCIKGSAESLASVITKEAFHITGSTAECGGEIVSEGGNPVIARGVCWSRSKNPTINDQITNNGKGIGAFESSISGLDTFTTYYFRAYATNSSGTAYGENKSFTTNRINLPDLIITEPDVFPLAINSNGVFTLSCGYYNQGEKTNNSSFLKAYLSKDKIPDQSDYLLFESLMLQPDYLQNYQVFDLAVPEGVTDGIWNILYVADAGHHVVESNEDNNISSVELRIGMTGISELSLKPDCKVFPNPGTGDFSVVVSPEAYMIRIFSVGGKIIQEINNPNHLDSFKLSIRESGVYYLRVYCKDYVSTIKVVVQ